MKEIRALTSLRGVAAIWVVLFHLDLERALFPPALHRWLAIGRGYIAVDLFFALSGFVLALTHRGDFLVRPFAAAYPDFLLRRVARVTPLNAVIVAALAAFVWLDPARVGDSFAAARDPWTVLANLLLVQDWGIAPSIDKPAWSVSIEMAVYLAFPLLLALTWSRRCWFFPAVAGMAALYWLIQANAGIASQGQVAGDLIRGFAGFSFGLLGFRAFASLTVPTLAGRFDIAVFAAFWAVVLFSPTDLMPILLCPFLIVSLAFERGPLARLLGLEPLHALGRISYSIYLVHFGVLGGLNLMPIRSGAIYGFSTIALTLGISWATYHWIERPARRWIARGLKSS
jgi:peptidoglycan/LPS O-acetylase OafA/YrhL